MGRKEGSKEKASRNGGRREGPPTNGTAGALTEDPRFSRLHTDPRFQRLPKNKVKLAIDSRFAHMFTEKGFNDQAADIRGMKTKSSRRLDSLRRYYKLDEEEDEGEGVDGKAQVGKSLTKKKRGKKDRAKKGNKVPSPKEIVENDGGTVSEEELGLSSKSHLFADGKPNRKKDCLGKNLHVRAGLKIAESVVHSENLGDLEDIDEVVETHLQRAKTATGFIENGESDEDSADDGGPILDDGLEEEDVEDSSQMSSSSSSSDSEIDAEEESSEANEEEKIPTTDDETRRLAVVNMDWEHIRAVHLLVLMRSFVPKGGRVNSVSIYPSDFGIEQMKEENVHGPKSIFSQNDDEDVNEEQEADQEKLREYEKAKLRYYYAVVDCDSSLTAAHLYKSCDGLEFERTSNTLDLRYIPDDMEFKHNPRDTASEVLVDYKPIEFETRALQHSNVKLTWDDDEPVRVKALRRNFNRDELNEMDFRAYVASSSESGSDAGEDVNSVDGHESINPQEEENKTQKVRSRYLSLLAGTEEADISRGKKAERGNIEIKFHTGLDELSEKLLMKAKKDRADETVWEAYLRRKKEKKNLRRQKKSADSDVSSEDEGAHSSDHPSHKDDPFFSYGDEDPFDDPFFSQGSEITRPAKTRKGKESNDRKVKEDIDGSTDEQKEKEDTATEKKTAARKQAELELLLLDDHMVQNGQGLQQISSSKNGLKKQKLKKNKGEVQQEKIASSANYDDPRFSSLFMSHHFALDPTDPRFKKTSSDVAEKQRQRFQSSRNAQDQLDNTVKQVTGGQGSTGKRKAELSSLVHSLKLKVQAKALKDDRRYS